MSDVSIESAARRSDRVAEAMLLLATAVWGSSFALAKQAGEMINRPNGTRALGPILTLAIRFTIAAGIVAIASSIFRRRARVARGASLLHVDLRPRCKSEVPSGVRQWSPGIAIGALLALGTVLQHLALDRTSEAAAAFLTSLAILFVPLILWAVLRQRPAAAAWVGVAIAVPGVWLMSGSSTFRIGTGEWLGVACAFVFAWHLLAVDRWAAGLGAIRACLAQFVMVAIVCWPISIGLIARLDAFDARVLMTRPFIMNVLLLVAGPTLVSFGLMAAYQPRVSPVRAVLIYLFEPVFAAAFAWLWTGRTISRGEVAGGALILVANGIVELRSKRGAMEGVTP